MLRHHRWQVVLATLLFALLSKPSLSLGGNQEAVARQAAPGQSTQAITAAASELAKRGALRVTGNEELMFDRTLLLEGERVTTVSGKKIDASYSKVQVGTQRGSGSAVFLEIGTTKGTELSPETVKVISDAVHAGRPEVQACVGDRKCIRLCDKTGKEECCEWRCGK
jgi:hypothetical protein